MNVFREAGLMQAWSRAQRASGRTVAFVPTLGCLHVGHAALCERARAAGAALSLSVFLNPLQFRRPQYEQYPQTLERDLELARSAGAGAVFAPSWAEMYPSAPSLEALFALQDLPAAARSADAFAIERPFGPEGLAYLRAPERLVLRMDGARFPWFYDGVSTVVRRLFEIAEPDVANFGEKDTQQLAIVQRLARGLERPVRIEPVPVVRDPDGLPASSRNTLLSAEQRRAALAAPRALARGAELVRAGERSAAAIRGAMQAELERHASVAVDYLDVIDAEKLCPLVTVDARALLYVAYFVDGVRLTDNRLALAGEPAA